MRLRRRLLLCYTCLVIVAFGANSATDAESAKRAFLDYWSALQANDVDRVLLRLHVDFMASTKQQMIQFLRGIPTDRQGQICRQVFGIGSLTEVERTEPKKFMKLAFQYEPMRKVLTSILDARFEEEAIAAVHLDEGGCGLRVPFKISTPNGEIAGVLKLRLKCSEGVGWQITGFEPPERLPSSIGPAKLDEKS